MSLPVNKQKLDENIVANLPINNGAQLINAQKLQDTLTPIINSTFGMKTIWAGELQANMASGLRSSFDLIERYYDPNYLPPTQDPGGALVLNSVLNKYKITTLGSGLLAANGTSTGSVTNVSVSPVGTVSNVNYGQGLTFDGYITAGVLTSLIVNNPGTGYAINLYQNTLTSIPYTINLSVISGGVRPVIQFNLANTIYPAATYNQTANNAQCNVFIPSVNSIFQYPTPLTPSNNQWSISGTVYKAPIFHISYNHFSYWDSSDIEQYSFITCPMSSSNTGYFTGGTINNNKPGFTFSVRSQFLATRMNGTLEIKVPIINTTI